MTLDALYLVCSRVNSMHGEEMRGSAVAPPQNEDVLLIETRPSSSSESKRLRHNPQHYAWQVRGRELYQH